MEREVVFYCFKEDPQESDVVKCDLEIAHELFDKEYAMYKEGKSKWDYFDITVNGKLLRSSKN